EAARDTVAAHFPGEYVIVPNGVDVDAFRRPQPRPPALADGRRHVVFVGRLEARKGVEHLVAAMPRVCARHAGARLVVVGDAGALSAALCELLDDDEERRRCGARGLAVARAYDWSVIAGRLESIYEAARDSRSDRAR